MSARWAREGRRQAGRHPSRGPRPAPRLPRGRGRSRPGTRGFTLLEVVIAVMLLALSLTGLLQVQTRNISQTAQAREMTVAVALARGKIIDVEQRLFHEGFQAGDLTQEGDFAEEGYPHVTYRYQVSEVELDLDKLGQAVGAVAKARGGDAAQSEGEFESMFGAVAMVAGPMVQTIAHSLRVMDLDISWEVGRARPHFSLRALLSQDDFSSMAAGDVARTTREVQEGAAAAAAAQQSEGSRVSP